MTRAGLAWLLAAAQAACGATSGATSAHVTVVSLVKLDCADCGSEVVAELRAYPGVYGATFDKDKAEVSVVASPGFDVLGAARATVAARGLDVLLGAGYGQYGEAPRLSPGADWRSFAAGGADVPRVEDLLAPGKVTVVSFSATWCDPCHVVERHMVNVLRARRNIAFRTLDMADWNTTLAEHYLKGVPKLPYVIVYAPSGARVRSLAGVDLDGLDAAIVAAEGAGPK
jgi:hypothetical protein